MSLQLSAQSQAVAHLHWATPLPWPWILALSLVLAVLAARAAVGLWSKPWGKALALLRLSSAALLLAVVLQPEWVTEHLSWQKPHIAVVLDTSASMATPTHPGATRLTDAQQWAQRALEDAQKPSAKRAVSVHTLGGPSSTDLLNDLMDIEAADAIVLLSDGGDNVQLGPTGADAKTASTFSDEATQKLVALGTPVSTQAVGARTPLQDVALSSVKYDAYGFVKNTLHVDVALHIEGYKPGLPLYVTVRGDEGIIAEQRLVTSGQDANVRLSFVPNTVGEFVYWVDVAPSPHEATLLNNRFAFTTQVVRDKIRVLHVAGRPSWDQRFLRETLKAKSQVDLVSFYILRTPYSDNTVPESELALIPFPVERLFTSELKNFDVVLFQNFDFRPFRMEGYLPNLARAIEEGLGFMMLGGADSLGQAGYGGTALEAQLATAVGGPSLILGPAQMVATAAGVSHPLLALCKGPGAAEGCLHGLPKLTNINPLGAVHPDATVLARAQTPHGASGSDVPLLVAREPGRGRTLTLATDALWHWRVHHGPTSAAARIYDRFWHQALLWLTHDPATAALKVAVSSRDVAVDAPLEIIATLPTAAQVPGGADALLRLEVAGLGDTPQAPVEGALRLAPIQADGRATFHLPGLPRGAYRFTVHAAASAATPQPLTAEAHVVVQPQGPELTHLAVKPDLLQQISAVTGGQVLPPDAPASALDNVPVARTRPPIVLGRSRMSLWDNGYVLALLVGALSLEWLLRRRMGLP